MNQISALQTLANAMTHTDDVAAILILTDCWLTVWRELTK